MTEQIAVQLRSAYLTCFYLYLFSSASRWKNCCSNEAYNIFYWFWEAVKPPCISASSPHSRSKNDNRKRMFLSFLFVSRNRSKQSWSRFRTLFWLIYWEWFQPPFPAVAMINEGSVCACLWLCIYATDWQVWVTFWLSFVSLCECVW